MDQTTPHIAGPDHRPSRRWVAPLVLGSLVALAAAVVVLLPRFDQRGRAAFDQINYHQRVIETFAAELPRPDLGDYLSATTPGYHLLLAPAKASGVPTRGLRLIGIAFAVLLVVVVSGFVATRAPPLPTVEALAVCLPLACSMYVLQSAMWLLPDDAAWLGVAVVIALALRRRVDVLFYAGGGAALCYLVLMRQIHLWAAAPIWTAAWLGVGQPAWPQALRPTAERVKRLAPALLATLPAFAVLAVFLSTWDGLTPPRFQNRYAGPNPATPAFVLALIGVFSVFFAGWIAPSLIALVRRRRLELLGTLVVGALLALAPETSYSRHEGRWSGLWNVAAMSPTVGERSVVIVALALVGAGALAAWLYAVPLRTRLVAGAALAGFTAAQATSPECWQRYSEPFVLMLLAMLAAESRRMDTLPASLERPVRFARAAGPALLGVAFAGLTAVSLARAAPARLIPLDELQDRIDRRTADEGGTGGRDADTLSGRVSRVAGR